jgi:hypothetical protein
MMQANEPGAMEAACHCGTVRFRVKLTDGFNTARRCTCSYCRMRGAVAVSADVGGITVDAGEEALTVYPFNTGVAQHYFLLAVRHLHASSASLQPESVRGQRCVPKRRQPV